jgi:hypothetical protein
METLPGKNLGGGASRALRQPAPGAAVGSRAARCGIKASLCIRWEEKGETGVTAAFLPWNWQQGASMLMPFIGQSCAMPRQQADRPAGCTVSRQADAGIAAHRATTASISNAPFLLQFMVKRSPAFIISIRRRFSPGSDLDHIRPGSVASCYALSPGAKRYRPKCMHKSTIALCSRLESTIPYAG